MHTTVASTQRGWSRLVRCFVLGATGLAGLPGCGLGLASTHDYEGPKDPEPHVGLHSYKVTDASGAVVYAEGCGATDAKFSLADEIRAVIPLDTEYRVEIGRVALADGELGSLDSVAYYCTEAERTTDGLMLSYSDPRCWGGAWDAEEHELLGVEIVAADGTLLDPSPVLGSGVNIEIGDLERFRLKTHVAGPVVVKAPVPPCGSGYNIEEARGLLTVLPVE
jgi:hypothetical protein